MVSLEGRVALITGASGVSGPRWPDRWWRKESSSALASRSGDDLGIDDAVARPCDVRDPAALDSIVDARPSIDSVGSTSWWPTPGSAPTGRFSTCDPEHLEEMIDVNVKGTIYAVRAALPHLLKSDAADIVTLASEAGRRGLPYEAVYCASKFGQVGFTRALDHELREQGVRCTNVVPWWGGHRLRDGPGPHSGHAGIGGDDDLRGRRRDRALRPHPAPQPPHPRGGDAPGDGDLLGLGASGSWSAQIR